MKHTDVKVLTSAEAIYTEGLKGILGRELEVPLISKTAQEYRRVIDYITDYCIFEKPTILPGQTIQFWSWMLKFIPLGEDRFTLFEADALGTGYIPGVDTALGVVFEQEKICVEYKGVPHFPAFDQMVVISDGVYDQDLPLEGVRYASPKHMSGWWLSTDLYDGNIKNMVPVHFHHVAFKRPDILKYLALPAGFRFFHASHEQEVMLDEGRK